LWPCFTHDPTAAAQSGSRSAVHKVLAREVPSTALLVLFISAVLDDRTTLDGSALIKVCPFLLSLLSLFVQVSDGWYEMDAMVDPLLVSLRLGPIADLSSNKTL